MAKVISSYTPAGSRKGTQMRKSEKQASAGLRGKAKENRYDYERVQVWQTSFR